MLQEPAHQTKDDKPQCQATTKKGVRFFFFFARCSKRPPPSIDRSIDRAYLITQPDMREFVSQRGFPEKIPLCFPLSRFLSSAACFFISRRSHPRLALLSRCLFLLRAYRKTGDQCLRPAQEGSKYCAQHTGGGTK
jgi:hypothetical protein